MLRFKNYISEAYSFFPTKESEFKASLTNWDEKAVEDATKLFVFLRSKYSSVASPINIDLSNQKTININRAISGEMTIPEIMKAAGITTKIKFGNGSAGNRGVNNRGNLFEPQFAEALNAWWQGEQVSDAGMLAAIKDLDKTYGLSKAKDLVINVVGGENTRRPIDFGSQITLTNTNGSGFDVGPSVTDITLLVDDKPIYLSLKLGGTTTFFNVGIKTILTTREIQDGKITNSNGLKLLNMLGIDQEKFCKVFNGELPKGFIDKNAKYDKKALETLLQSGIGYGYHVLHKKGKKIDSYRIDQSAMKKMAKPGKVTIYYGGKTGGGKRVNVEFESAVYKFSINIRDTQGKDGYPTRMMCDFKGK